MKKTWLIAMVMVGAVACTGYAQEDVLGTIDFPNSGEADAQRDFLNGVRKVHSFEWEDAVESFQEAQKIDPDFFLAYWGEALSHYEGHHFSASSTDVPAGRAALEKLARTKKERLDKAANDRERGYLEAVELLYGAGLPEERTLAYSDRMAELWKDYPEDHEAATLYALALMRTKVRGEDSIRTDMQSGAISQMVFRANPDHPGAAHYIIHAYDDPIYAPIALYAAHKFSEIAPAAVHALHMPAHIFVQHGMWDQSSRGTTSRTTRRWRARNGRDSHRRATPGTRSTGSNTPTSNRASTRKLRNASTRSNPSPAATTRPDVSRTP